MQEAQQQETTPTHSALTTEWFTVYGSLVLDLTHPIFVALVHNVPLEEEVDNCLSLATPMPPPEGTEREKYYVIKRRLNGRKHCGWGPAVIRHMPYGHIEKWFRNGKRTDELPQPTPEELEDILAFLRECVAAGMH